MTVAQNLFWGRSASTIGCAASTSPPNSSCNRSISTSRRQRRSDFSAPPRSNGRNSPRRPARSQGHHLDEPTATLTPEEKKYFFDLVRDLKRRGM